MHWDGFLNWLFDFEYKKIGIPTPDEVIYLAVDPEVSQRLLTERYQGHEEKKDIQEKDRTVKSVGCARLKASMMRSSRNWKRSFKLRAKELRGKGRSLCCGSPPQKILPH